MAQLSTAITRSTGGTRSRFTAVDLPGDFFVGGADPLIDPTQSFAPEVRESVFGDLISGAVSFIPGVGPILAAGVGVVDRAISDRAQPAGIDRNGCLPFMTPDPISGECRFDFDPGSGTGAPGGGAAAGTGLNRPNPISRMVLECPRFADGKRGILWMNALTGDVVCLPRRTSGKGFGLIRKNPPRQKPFISAAEKRLLTKITSVQKRAKKFAMDAGFACKKR